MDKDNKIFIGSPNSIYGFTLKLEEKNTHIEC